MAIGDRVATMFFAGGLNTYGWSSFSHCSMHHAATARGDGGSLLPMDPYGAGGKINGAKVAASPDPMSNYKWDFVSLADPRFDYQVCRLLH